MILLIICQMITGHMIIGTANAQFADVQAAYQTKQYFSAARLAFNEATHAPNNAVKAMAYAWATNSLVKAGLDQSAFYFFIRTLQLQDHSATQRVLDLAPMFIERIGPDDMRKYLTKYTRLEDYSPVARNAFWVVVAKEKLLKGDYNGALQATEAIQTNHSLYPVALQIRGTALTLTKRLDAAIDTFQECADKADMRLKDPDFSDDAPVSDLLKKWRNMKKQAAQDLKARCKAGEARALYEMNQFEEADRVYDQIPKASFVWTDTLFEHAWNSYAREEYNRTLGKLVSYKSPALQFMFNSETDVLMAQSYMALCLYRDAGLVIERFTTDYAGVARQIKQFVESYPTQIEPYYIVGRNALKDKLHTSSMMNRFLNRFVRSPYFQNLALAEERAIAEKIAIQRIDLSRPQTSTGMNQGFPGFLNQILDWRIRTVKQMGGIFVKNSIIDYHQVLIADFEKMQFMKIDMLAHMKQRLMEPEAALATERSRGNRIPVRRNDQYLWSFNGEFWNDEIGDYVFALESECAK